MGHHFFRSSVEDRKISELIRQGNPCLVLCCILNAEGKTMYKKETNFRDLGGLIGADGRRIKKGLFYRSASPVYMDDLEIEELKSLRLYEILDLRTSYEVEIKPDPVLPGVQYKRISGMRDAAGNGIDYSPEGIHRLQMQKECEQLGLEEYMRQIYQNMMFGNKAFMHVLDLIRQEHLPVLFHCATGKDRTGAVAMILLLALGVSEEDIMKDYLASNESFIRKIKMAETINAEELRKDPSYRDVLLAENGVLPSNGRLLLNSIKERYNNLNEYLKIEYNLNQNDIAEIRNRLLQN
jgi:Protein tyrosine/serine phosphatase